MHLKRLELLGFKSFANKTVLEFDQGVTAIVGPNGSGKSNVVDAVRWALGEQSLRAVRSKKSDEVIFAGNSKRAPVGMAEVTLVLDNSDSSLPLAFSEVSITRRQYRSGEGEYLINRARARLKDVVELLTHANLGPDAYAVVGQGAVDEVLLQRPEERRALLETAAGIAGHQMKLKESLDRLSETDGNIQRVEDIQSEITPQLSRLRVQASRARRYEEVAERLRQSLRWRYLLQVRQAVQRTETALAVERGRAQAVGESSRSLELLRQRVSTARERLREQERALEASRERLSNLRLAKARGDRELALAREREASHRRELREAEEELASAQKEHRDLEMEMARLRTSRTAMAAREAEARSAIEPVEAERRRAQAEMRIVQAQLDRSASDRQGGATRQSELRERCNALQRQMKRAEDGRGESEKAARAASAKLVQLEQEIGALAGEMEKLHTVLEDSEARRQEVQRNLAELAPRMEAARRRERASWEKDSHLRSRLSLLQSLRNENRGMPPGTKKLLESDLPGIRGVLASMIQVPQQYVTAVSAALGSSQTHLVSDGFQEALTALGTLRNGSGRATVSPLRMEGRQQSGEPTKAFRSGLNGTMDGLGFHGFASDLVTPEPGAEELCVRYLGLTMVVETMADAVELFHRLCRHAGGTLPFQVVTMDGRLLRARGDMSSAPAPDKEGSLVAMETEIRTLASEAGAADREKEEARAEVIALEAEHATLSGEASRLSAETSRLQGELARRTSQHTGLASQLAKAEAAIEWHNSRVSTTDLEASQAGAALSKAQSELEEAQRRVGDAEARMEQLRGDLSEQQSLVSELSAKLSRLHSQVQAAQGQMREMEARASALAEAHQRAGARARRQEERVAQLRGAIEEPARQPQAAMSAEQRQEMEKLESSVELSTEAVARNRAEMESLEGDLARLSGDYGEAREELSQARARVERGSAETSALLREAARELDLELDTAEDGSEPPDLLIQLARGVDQLLSALLADMPAGKLAADLPTAIQKAEAARKELHSLGTVNPEAPEEYRAASERHEFLAAQMEDLRQAEKTLRKAIEELRGIMEERFRASFQKVNEEFGRCFTTLFGGGTAKLVLTQPDDPPRGGVDVLATPPGKKPGSLISLSGGERSLTAVALLFALMRVSPGPFCLLDEVDAALDESNVKRFCEMVHTLADKTQFMVITHNRTTMETASALYGVSMSADSVSRVVSLKLNEHDLG